MRSLFNKDAELIQIWEDHLITWGKQFWALAVDVHTELIYTYRYVSDGLDATHHQSDRPCPRNWIVSYRTKEV